MMSAPVPPSDFLCPITKQIMDKPVRSRHGGPSFESTTILKWLQEGHISYCPITNMPLTSENLEPNKKLEWKIRYWKMKNGCEESSAKNTATTTKPTTTITTTTTTEFRHDEEANNIPIPPPAKYFCPLTKTIMTDPVMTSHGHNFERRAIMNWIENTGEICPISYKPLELRNIISHRSLKIEIRQWKESNEREESYVQTLSSTQPQAIDNINDSTDTNGVEKDYSKSDRSLFSKVNMILDPDRSNDSDSDLLDQVDKALEGCEGSIGDLLTKFDSYVTKRPKQPSFSKMLMTSPKRYWKAAKAATNKAILPHIPNIQNDETNINVESEIIHA